MILLLTIGTAIPQTRPTAYYDYENKEYPPGKNVNLKNINCKTFFLYFRKREFLLNIIQ